MSAVTAARRHRVWALGCAVGVAVGLAGCGKSNVPPSSENNGIYVSAGPITYQLEVSRELNQYSTEDRQYVIGLPHGTSSALSPNQLWYGVFLWAKNQANRPAMTTDNVDIVDTAGNHYRPVALNPALNPYAWTAQSLAPGETEPGPNTTASFGPTQGGLLLFKLDTVVYDNRPLTLELKGPSGKIWATISLDL